MAAVFEDEKDSFLGVLLAKPLGVCIGKKCKEERAKRREKRQARREQRRALRMRRREARVKKLEAKAQGEQLDNQAKEVQVQTTAQLAQAELTPQADAMPNNAVVPTNTRNKTMLFVGIGVGVLVLIGVVLFITIKKD